MALHIVTVAFADSPELTSTYASCQAVIAEARNLRVVHWIFVKRYSKEIEHRYPGAHVLPSHDTGIYHAMNLAFDSLRPGLANDDLLVYLNAGDLLDVAPLMQHVEAHQSASADLSLAGTALTRGSATVGFRPAPAHPSTTGRIIYSQYPCHQSTFYSAAFLQSVWSRRGRIFVEEYRACADLDLYLQAQGTRIVTTPFVTSAYDTEGFSAQQSVMVAREKAHLVRTYRAGLLWRIYACLWMLKARLVAPKRALHRLLGASS